ncbi:response regulator transcription factor [Rossellomorea marisflavi]|uniref:Two-component system response regulator n=1 Tax=Rossellomorea marisflavi TaxID=189381 RepID=A0A161TGR5_9BACI|nr:response regulator transcription factor [Rossellomorea marisflavi]KMK91652.1 chemotaxis protein CheY [Rossellomorea marisflavi]KZE50190.1 two-component system response regulator [Rossellomorea marisflavi]
MKRIMIIEDEESIRGFIKVNLKRYGYVVLEAGSAEEGIELLKAQGADILLLDVMLPGMDGFEACGEIRKWNPAVGIIMLTAKVQEMDKVHGLMNGADDYVSKPFSPNELIARIESLFRRLRPAPVPKPVPDWFLDEKKRLFYVKGKEIDLSPVEYELVTGIIRKNGQAVSRNDLLDKVWGVNYMGDPKIVDVNIRRIRQKIEENPSNPRFLLTVWGFGYRWNEGREHGD